MKKTVIFVFLVWFSFSFICAQINPDFGLMGDYPFTGNASDQSGNNYHGTVFGPSLTTDRMGNPNAAYLFDGINDYIDLNYDFDYQLRSINVWFNAYSIHTGQSDVIYDTDHSGLQFGPNKIRVIDQGGKKLRMNAGAGTTIQNFDINQNQWYMATMTVSGDSIHYYLDGCLVGRVAFGNLTGNWDGHATVPLGTSRIFDRYFKGKIDDLRIYNRVLTPDEVAYLYDGFGCSDCQSEPTHMEELLECCYPFNTGAKAASCPQELVFGALPATDRFGNINSAYEFDGVDDYIDLNVEFDFPSRSLNLWFNAYTFSPIVPGNLYYLGHKSLQFGSTQIYVQEDNGPRLFMFAGDNMFSSGTPIDSSQWHMATITVDPNKIRYYLDGCRYAEYPFVSDTGVLAHQTALLGTSGQFDGFFNGKIDDVSVYSRALNPSEVRRLFQNGIVCPLLSVIGDPEGIAQADLVVFPNPVSDQVELELKGEDLIEDLFLYNMEGRLVYAAHALNHKRATIGVRGLSSGIYSLRIQSSSGKWGARKILVH